MDKIELRKIGSLRLHPDNVAIFGLPTGEPNYEEIREDIKRRGLQEPLIILADGTILSGHIRYASVCWVLAQRGLTPDQIKDEVIAVRIHADFESKGEELEYLMDANDKRRQLDPRRIASVFERVLQVIEANTIGKKGKKGEAVQALADKLGTSHKLAKSYCAIFGSRIVPDEVKDKVNSKDLAPSIVLEAIKFAEESAKRENRAPSMADVDAYITHSNSKTSLADTVRQLSSKPVLPSVSPQPKPPNVKPAPPPEPTFQKPQKVIFPLFEEIYKTPSPGPVENPPPPVEPEVASEPLNTDPEPQRDFAESTGTELEEKLPYPESDKISDVRGLLKEALRTVVLDDSVISNLRGLHTELTSYLLAMGLIEPPKQLSLPSNPLAQVELCTSILQSLDGSSNPQSVRDSLLDLVNFARIAIEKLTNSYATCTKDGLVGPADIEPVRGKEEPTLKSGADLASILETTAEPAPEPKKPEYPIDLHTEVPLSSLKIDSSPETREKYKEAFQASPGTTKTAEPKKDPSPPSDEEANLVSSVIDDFMDEIKKAGLASTA